MSGRLAAKLGRVNNLWDDETLFQEARRLVTAQIQHVTYREFLPAVLGENLAENLQLMPQTAGHFSGYDIDAYPGALEAAASTALSFSLAMLPAKFETFTMVNKIFKKKKLNRRLGNQNVPQYRKGIKAERWPQTPPATSMPSRQKSCFTDWSAR